MDSYGIRVLSAEGHTIMNTDDPLLVVKAKGTVALPIWATATQAFGYTDQSMLSQWGSIGTTFYRATIAPPLASRTDMLFIEIPPGQRAHWIWANHLGGWDVTSSATALRWVVGTWADTHAPRTSGWGMEVRRADGSVVWSDDLPIVALSALLANGVPGAWVATEARLLGRREIGGPVVSGGYRPGALRAADGSLTPQGLGLPSEGTPNAWVSPDARIRGLVANINFSSI